MRIVKYIHHQTLIWQFFAHVMIAWYSRESNIYKVVIWKRADIGEPDVPGPTNGHEWTIKDGIIKPLWTKGEILPLQLESILEEVVDEELDEEDGEFNEHEYEIIDFEDEDSNA